MAAGTATDMAGRERRSGLMLFAAALLAIALDNSPLAPLYDALLTTRFSVAIEDWALSKPFLLWINDGLMALFFLLVGAEIKREATTGALRDRRAAILPLAGAAGGMIVPALLYLAVNGFSPPTVDGWAIPAATDIAFALGVLALFGPGIPPAARLFLLVLAIFDDMGAIVIIALFYSGGLSPLMLTGAGIVIAALLALNRFGVRHLAPYVVLGALAWLLVLQSGVHATLAGALVGLILPVGSRSGDLSPARRLEEGMHPWIAYLVLPLFAFANAGLKLGGILENGLMSPIAQGTILGLVVGKPVGILAFTWIVVRLEWTALPGALDWRWIAGLGALAGIGFTMSLFIGTLAFPGAETADAVRAGVLTGSLVSGLLGWLIISSRLKKERKTA